MKVELNARRYGKTWAMMRELERLRGMHARVYPPIFKAYGDYYGR